MTDPEATERPGSSLSRQGLHLGGDPRPSSRSSLPSPDAQNQTQNQNQELQQQQQQQQQQQPPPLRPPPFQPLFTLVTDSTSRATHHPQVHYIFSDDDPDLLTSALARHHSSLAAADSAALPGALHASTASIANAGPPSSRSPRPPAERAVVLDLVPRRGGSGVGYDVAWASSLASDWAVTGAKVVPMVGEEGAALGDADRESGAGAEGRRLMLQIEGLSIEEGSTPSPARSMLGGAATAGVRSAAGKAPSPMSETGEIHSSTTGGSRDQNSGGRQGQTSEEDYGTLIDEFERRMAVLKRVVDAGQERRQRVAAAVESPQGQPSREQGSVEQEGADDHHGRAEEGD